MRDYLVVGFAWFISSQIFAALLVNSNKLRGHETIQKNIKDIKKSLSDNRKLVKFFEVFEC